MSVLHLDNVPEELYRRIEQLAAANRVPVAEEATRLLRQATDQLQAGARLNVLEHLESLRRNRIVPPPGTPDSLEMLREDRSR